METWKCANCRKLCNNLPFEEHDDILFCNSPCASMLFGKTKVLNKLYT